MARNDWPRFTAACLNAELLTISAEDCRQLIQTPRAAYNREYQPGEGGVGPSLEGGRTVDRDSTATRRVSGEEDCHTDQVRLHSVFRALGQYD